jgi:surface polysaccharide O-acyltransferase-like enzyme
MGVVMPGIKVEPEPIAATVAPLSGLVPTIWDIPADKSRLLWPDLVRTTAICWVVLIHTAAVPRSHLNDISLDWWWWSDLYDGFSRAAVPMFIMVSGALLLTRREFSLLNFARRRMAKVAFPLLAWGLIYLGWRAVQGEVFSPGEILRHLVSGSEPASTHLWFLYVIVSLYLIAPILNVFVLNSSTQVQLYFVVLWALATFVQPVIEENLNFQIGLNLGPVSGFVGFFVLGAIIERSVPEKLSNGLASILVGLFCSGWAVAVFGTYSRTITHSGSPDEYYLDSLAPNVAVMSVAAYLLVRHFGSSHHMVSRLGAAMAPLAFGIYLIHPIVLDLLDYAGMHLDPMLYNPAWYVPVVSLTVVVVSAGLSKLMRDIPFLRPLVP